MYFHQAQTSEKDPLKFDDHIAKSEEFIVHRYLKNEQILSFRKNELAMI